MMLTLVFAFMQDVTAYRVGKIVTVTSEAIDDGVIVVKEGRIVALGRASDVAIPEGATVVDQSANWAVPGFVDLHCHVGGGRGWDINDMVLPTNPGLGTRPTVQPNAEELLNGAAAGVTTVLYIPGSGTNMGGFGTLMKTAGGDTVEDLVIRYPGALKVAQAWNPERGAGDVGHTRGGMWWNLRETLDRAKVYDRAWTDFETGASTVKPAEDPELEPMRGLVQKKFPVIIHTADARDVMGTMRMFHDDYDLWMIVTHGEFGAYKIAHEAAKRGVYVNVGPRNFDFAYPYFGYMENHIQGIAAGYYDAGVRRLSLCTDSPVIPQESLQLQGTYSAMLGLPVDAALRALTIEPARAIGIDGDAGSLEVGKTADIVFWTGDPLDVRRYVTMTVIRGKAVYDVTREKRRY